MANDKMLLFLGDSITEQWGVLRQAFFTENHFSNRGIGGEATGHVRARFADAIADTNPAGVHLLCGINDIGEVHGPLRMEDTKANLAFMIDTITGMGLPLLVGSVLPAWFNWRPEARPAATIAVLNVWLRAKADACGASYVDYNRAMGNREGCLKPPYALDGLHLTTRGYARMELVAVAAVRRRFVGRAVGLARGADEAHFVDRVLALLD